MSVWALIVSWFSRWIDAVADFIVALSSQFASPPRVRLVEVANGEFTVHPTPESPVADTDSERIRIVDGRVIDTLSDSLAATLRGSCIELTLLSERFLFRSFELPHRAVDFLDGIVRAQIDRLTPWSAADAAFGCSKPSEAGSERIVVTVAATARALISPYIQAVVQCGARSMNVFTAPPEGEAKATPIKVMEEKTAGLMDVGKICPILVRILLVSAISAAAALAASSLLVIHFDAQLDALTQRIASLRTAAGVTSGDSVDSPIVAQRILEERKHTAPSSIMIIETLSRILPDSTYLTELRIEHDKIQLVGITHDAPSLIGLMEHSGRFTRATFFAPTTRSPSAPGESFHIEAAIQPSLSTQP